jgi:hypothetical protein
MTYPPVFVEAFKKIEKQGGKSFRKFPQLALSQKQGGKSFRKLALPLKWGVSHLGNWTSPLKDQRDIYLGNWPSLQKQRGKPFGKLAFPPKLGVKTLMTFRSDLRQKMLSGRPARTNSGLSLGVPPHEGLKMVQN